jgi:hypothetical protein
MGYHQWEFSDLYKRYVSEKDPDRKKRQEQILLERWDDELIEGGVFIDKIEANVFGIEFHL